MQPLSLEDELKKFDEIPYDIDFSKDYSTAFFEVLSDAPPSQIMEDILSPPEVPALPASTEQSYPTIDWDAIDKATRKEKKREKRWKRRHKKIKPKKAIKNIENLMKEWGI